MSNLKNKHPVNIFWFRRDLRVKDNIGLFHALKSDYPVLPIFIFDSNILDNLTEKKDARVEFIYESLKDIQDLLLSKDSTLHVIHDSPIRAFKQLFSLHDIKSVYTNHDYEPYAIERDDEVKKFLETQGAEFLSFKDQCVFEKNEIVKSDGKPYTIFTPYSKTWLSKLKLEIKNSENYLGQFFKQKEIEIPVPEKIGFNLTGSFFPKKIIKTEIIRNYEEQRNFPYLKGTSLLGLHLRFGTISIRKCVEIALELNKAWLLELIWRDFFMQILWHFPKVVTESFKPKYDKIKWLNDEKDFKAWCDGRTGYPLVDAGMRELNQTGFMHNRVRMVTASFLTKHLLIDWRFGERYFAKKLLDYELSSNNGNWQWAAGCGCDAAPYFRVFNPYIQQKKFDPENEYIKKWVSEFESQQYLKPIIEHDFARNRAIKTYKNSLE